MRVLLFLLIALLSGCSLSTTHEAAAPDDSDERVAAKPSDAPPPDLRTRKSGDDWPCFLGPTGDSVSREKGILSPWPAKGPRIVWRKETDMGYAMPAISRTRLALKVISLMRFRMSRAVSGTSGRFIGLIWTITTSLLAHSWIKG